MDYTISYFSEAVQEDILALPDTLAARYVVLSRRMVAYLFLHACRKTHCHAAQFCQKV